jgi:predicted XRE-type DNA-binding protein
MGYALYIAQMGERPKGAKPLKGFRGVGILELSEIRLVAQRLRAAEEDYRQRQAAQEGFTAMTKGRGIEMQDASENIFADLGRPAAAAHYVKAQLVFQVQHIMQARQLTQSAAAALMGIKQPDVSNMLRGRFRGYSIDRIFSFLQALDQDIEIVIKPKASQEQVARIIVKAA